MIRSGLLLDRNSVSFYFCLHLPPWTKWPLDLVCSCAFPSAVDIHLCQILVVSTIVKLGETASAHERMISSGVLLSLGLVLLAVQFGCSLTVRHKGFINVEQTESIHLSELLWCLIVSMWNKSILHRTQSIYLIAIHANTGRPIVHLSHCKKLKSDSFKKNLLAK